LVRPLAIALVVALVALLVGHTIIIREAAERVLAAQIGCRVNIGSARVGGGGSIVLRRVRLHAPGVGGDGGVFLESESVKAEIDWAALLVGGQGVRRMRLVDPIVRLSQDASTGELNLLRVGGAGRSPGAASGSTGAITPLPEVEFVAGRIEFGESNGRAYTVLASIPVEGQVRVPSIAIAEYEIDLTEIVTNEQRPPMRVTGEFNVQTLSGTLNLVDLDLDRWQGWSAPVAASALWKQMNIRGRVAEASFTADRDSSVTAWFTLDGVRLTMPIEAPGLDARLIRASDVDGTIRFTPEGMSAELVGIVEDMPARMDFRTDGLSVIAPLTCTITTDRFLVSDNPGLLRFIPAEARDLFHEFGGPTGEVSGRVDLSRGEPIGNVPAPIIARGELRIEDGRGEHEVFPYPVGSITGAIRFDEHEIELVGIRGVAPSGATLRASGTIAPPTEGNEVHVELLLGDIPIDSALERAMPPEARRVLRTLIHEPGLDELRRRGLLLTAADRGSLDARLGDIAEELDANAPGGEGSAVRRIELLRESATINQRLSAPGFELGGVAGARVLIERNGPSDRLHKTIDIRLGRAGLLPEPFPYPFVATNFNIVVTDDGVTATADRLEGLTGARGNLIAVIAFADGSIGSPGATLIDIDLEQGPVDALMLAATPAPGDAGADNLYDAVSGLRVGGEVTGSIVIDSTKTDGFRAELHLTDLRLSLAPTPGADEPALEVTGLSGPMIVTDTLVEVGPIVGSFRDSPVAVRGLWREAEPDPTGVLAPNPIRAQIDLDGFNLASRIDPVIALLGEGSASRWASLRDTRSIEGMLDLRTSIELAPGRPARVRTSLRNIRGLSFVAYGDTVEIDRLAGEITADAERIRLIGCVGPVRLGGRLDGRLSVNGELRLDEGGAISIEAALTDTGFDAELLGALSSAEEAPDTLRQWLVKRRPSGVCDIAFRAHRGSGEALDWSFDFSPRAIELQSGPDRLLLRGSGPGATVHAGGGEVERIRLENEDCTIDLSGLWRLGDRAAIDLDFTIDARRLSRGMHALAPDDVNALLDSLEIGIDEPWSLTRGELRWRTDTQRFFGESEFAALRCDPGVAITGAKGRAVMRIERSEERADPEIEIEITTDEMRLAGIRMTGGAMSLHTGALPGRLVIDHLSADAHNGRVTGSVIIDTTTQAAALIGESVQDGVWYEAMFDFAGVSVESLLNDTATLSGSDPSDARPRAPIEGFTGRFDGRVSLAGAVGDESSRRGRGVFRIQGGELLMAPLMMPVIELSNLRAPSGEALERADAEVYIDGSLVHVEEVRLRSDSISIVGQGEVTWPGMDLNLAFNSRSNTRVPLLSDLIEGLRNELLTTVVTGTLLDPRFRTESFTGARQALDDLFGDGPGDTPGGGAGAIRRSTDAEGVSSMPPTRRPEGP
jgi:hypothetical protein